MKKATIKTSRGVIQLDLYDEECPGVVANFEKLVKQGFYNGLRFHRVIPNFMVQGGDPLTKDEAMKPRWGTGGPGYQIECNISPKRGHQKGSLAMAHAGSCRHDPASGKLVQGRCSNGSQFYITHKATDWLDGVHTVFGQVTEGQNVVDAIQAGDKIDSITVA